MPRRHIPTLYPHTENDNDNVDPQDVNTQWNSTGHLQLSYGSSGLVSSKTRQKQRSQATFTPAGHQGVIVEPSFVPKSDVYSQFVKRYRSRPIVLDDPRDDQDNFVRHIGTGHLFDEDSDEEYQESSQNADNRELHRSLLVDNEPMEPYTFEDRERLEWQSMLASVLDGDVLRSEKSRIQVALMASSDSGNNRHLDIWFGLRAKLRGRSVEEERKLLEERKMHLVDRVISEISQFRVVDSPEYPSAAHQVNVILQHLDKIQSFYPHLKAFHMDKPAASHPDFQTRCDTLIAWSNVYAALRQQINIFRKWTGSETLDVMARSTEHGKSKYSIDATLLI